MPVIVVFLGFTAYDTTKIRDNYQISPRSELLQKASVFSALQLYLDFINLFLYIIRLNEPESEIGKNLSGERKFLCKNKEKWNFAEN